MDIARRSTDEELYRKLDEDGSKQMIFKMAWRAVEVVMMDRRIFKRLKVMSTLCDTGMPVQKGNLGNERTTTTKAASIRKQQLGTKHSKTNEESG